SKPKASIRELLFYLAYGAKAILSIELTLPTTWTLHFSKEKSKVKLRANMNLITKAKARAYLRNLTYKKIIAKTFNTKVHPY
ncbi:hypothetical protein MUK42_02152, partial [Musa troglodytarum]